ncbi:ABC-2 type transport system permease [Enterococcus sp. DIV0840]|uniref:ABC transporter permease n=1 Tax=unclassified Enterococcus TaxID=2608891 RepID=UPI001A8EA06D|nr:ABC transporter permease [Enterococcus sp. DIV0849a]MBO0435277.1 ABC transporter permease [Enterococcus sp. DIV0849a]
MSVFKATLGILKKNLGTLILALAISLGISFAYSGSYSPKSNATELEKMNVVIFNTDHGNTAKQLETYLKQTMNVVSLKDTQEKIDDALFFGKVDYVLTIPDSFSQTIKQNQRPKLTIQVKPDSFNQVYIDSIINNYLSTYQFYQEAFPGKTEAEIANLTTTNLAKVGQINFDSSYNQSKKNKATGKVFGVLAYTMFMTIFSAITLVSLAFNPKEIKLRNDCSPLSKRSFSRQQFIVQLGFCLALWAVFVCLILLVTKSNIDRYSAYFILNTLLLFIVAVSFSNLIGGIISNPDMVSGINNVFILGSAFVSGVFVPVEILPDIVTKVASFTPTYWYMRNCTLIGNTVQFNNDFSTKFQFNSLILLIFAVIFFLLAMLTRTEHGGLKFSFSKIAIKK